MRAAGEHQHDIGRLLHLFAITVRVPLHQLRYLTAPDWGELKVSVKCGLAHSDPLDSENSNNHKNIIGACLYPI